MKSKIGVLIGCCVAMWTLSSSAAGILEEVVVTAQKREQGLQDVGIAVSAFTGDQLDSLGFDDSSDIIQIIPSVHIGSSVGGQSKQYTVRGVTQNDFSDHTESPIATYIDGTYILASQGQSFTVFDLERVEVLKGPQGTLFGRNATGGLVHFVTRKPTEEVEGSLKVEYGDYDQVKVEGAVGGRLSDSVRARLAGAYSSHNSYLQNDYDPNSPSAFNAAPELLAVGSGSDLGAETNEALRAHMEFDLNDSATLLLSANWAQSEMSTSPYQSVPTSAILDASGNQVNAIAVSPAQTALHFFEDGTPFNTPAARPVPGGDITGYLDPDGVGLGTTSSDFAFDDLNTVDVWGTSAKLEWEFGNGTSLVAISDYKSLEKYIGMDVDAAPVNQLAFLVDAEVTQFSQEIRLQGSSDNLEWVGGLYYLSGDYDNATGFKVFNNGPLVLPPNTFVGDYPADVEQSIDNVSLFGQIEYSISDTLSFIAGLRLIREDKEYDYALNYRLPDEDPRAFAGGVVLGDFGSLAGLPFATTFKGESSDNLWTGKVQLDWRANDDLLVYSSINRGVKAGGFNAPIDFGGGQLTPGFNYQYDEEILLAYEVGFKSDILDGSARLNGSLYYYDYQDYQAFVFAGVSGVVVNADAKIVGGEIELTASPIDGLDIVLSAGAFDAEVKDVSVSTGLIRDVKPSFAPELSYSVLARYGWTVGGGVMAIQTNLSYTDDFFYSLRNFDSTTVDNYTLVNARVSYAAADDKWEFAAFVDNVTDEEYTVTGFDISLFCGCSETTTGKPRWWGVSFKRNF